MRLPEADRAKAQAALQVLVGLPLSDMWRPCCQKFEFGEQKPHLNHKGQEVTWADWGLCAYGRWRIDGKDGFLLSWEHFGSTKEGRKDDHAMPFYESLETEPPIVKSVTVYEDGGLCIEMTRYKLILEPTDPEALKEEEWELWTPESDPRGHLMFGEGRIQWMRHDAPL